MSGVGPILAGALLGCGVAALVVARRPGRRSHRSQHLNEALHELRRPLQALALSPAPPGSEQWIVQAGRALAELEAAVNGPPVATPLQRGPVGLGELIEAARARWAGAGYLRFELETPDPVVRGDPVALASALDNLIANALEHGRGPVTVRGLRADGAVRVQVANLPRAATANGPPGSAVDPRHGHGLRRAARIAGEHGGVLLPPRLGCGAVLTELQLPAAGREQRVG